jgi:hypothetical protein
MLRSCRSLVVFVGQELAVSTRLLFQSATRVQVIGNGKYPAQTGRLVAVNINNDLTTGTDPFETFATYVSISLV